MYLTNSILPKTLALKLHLAGERSVKKRHPWVFSNSISKLNLEGKSGDVAIIFSKNGNKVLGVGLYDPFSPIRIKMLHFGGGITLNEAYFSEKIAVAFSVRSSLLKTKTNSYRLLFGENDGFPGLIADVYASILVVKLYSTIWLPYLKFIIPALKEISNTTTGIMRLGRNCAKQMEASGIKEGEILYGYLENETVNFTEHGIHFGANLIKGHKTGYFLDHRHNRKLVGSFSKGKTVLDVFAYAGGFSVHALANGAKEVTSLDISEQALALAKENGKLNTYVGTHKTIAGDAFKVLDQLKKDAKTFDIVVIDPPSFAKSAKETEVAHKKYNQLARLGASLVKPKGMLVLASCSSRVSAADFFEINENAFTSLGKKWKLKQSTFHDIDHPINFPEGAYLKCGYYQL